MHTRKRWHRLSALVIVGLSLIGSTACSPVEQAMFRLSLPGAITPKPTSQAVQPTSLAMTVNEDQAVCDELDRKHGPGTCGKVIEYIQSSIIAPQPKSQPTASTPREIGRQMAAERGWVGKQWEALDILWGKRESGWNPKARNKSGACGIPQALPCSKIKDKSITGQITWGLDYIADRYGSPARALAHSYARGWY